MFQLKWLWKHMGSKRHLLVIGLCLSVVTSVMQVINPVLSQKLIDEVITPRRTQMLLPILGLMMVVQLAITGLRYLMIVCLEINSQNMMDDVRRQMYHVIQNEDSRFFGYMRTGDLMTRMTNDLDLIRHATAWISYSIVDSITLFLVIIVYFATVNLQLTLCLAAVTPFILIVTMAFSKIIHPMYGRLREKLSRLNTVAQENIEGNRVVKAFAREEYEKEKFEGRNEEYRKANLKTAYVGVKFQPVIDLLSQSLTVITLLVGGIFMINGSLTAGELMAFSSMTWALANPLKNLGMILNDVQRFFASCNMIIEIYYAQPRITDWSDAKDPAERPRGEVAFEHAGLTIDSHPILQDISFRLKPGQKLGVMGSTGAGKTSLVNLLTRFYEPTSGQVLLDGKSVKLYTLNFLRRSVAMAMQDVFLYSDTAEGNICYGCPDIPFEEVQARAVDADADSFIRRLQDGYDTLLGERGVGLSGGQKQRISLARALAMKPPVLVLDDTTSAVDMETEQYIQNKLRHLDFPCTKIMIAQRVASVQDADLILILDQGRVVERGTHEELLAQRGYYYHIWALQNDVKEGEPVGA